MSRSPIRWYSEAEHTFGLPRDSGYAQWPKCKALKTDCPTGGGEDCACELVPVILPRDTRMWLSIEDAARRGIAVPDNWRELT